MCIISVVTHFSVLVFTVVILVFEVANMDDPTTHLTPFLTSDNGRVGGRNGQGVKSRLDNNSTSISITDLMAPFPSIRTIPLTLLHLSAIAFCQLQLFFEWFGTETDDIRFLICPSLLLALFICTYFFMRVEHRRIRAYGYLDRAVASLIYVRLPILVAALGALASSLLYHTLIHLPSPYQSETWFTPLLMLRLVLSLEHFVLMVVCCIYLIACVRHNRAMEPPDLSIQNYTAGAQGLLPPSLVLDSHEILNGGNINAPTSGNSHSPAAPNNRPSANSAVLRHRDAVILYLQTQVRHLSQELIRLLRLHDADDLDDLQPRQNSRTGTGADSPRHPGSNYSNNLADLEYMLAGREQELRSIAADRERWRMEASQSQERFQRTEASAQQLEAVLEQTSSKLVGLQKEFDELKKKHQKLNLILEVEKEANEHAQETLQRFRDSNHSLTMTNNAAGLSSSLAQARSRLSMSLSPSEHSFNDSALAVHNTHSMSNV